MLVCVRSGTGDEALRIMCLRASRWGLRCGHKGSRSLPRLFSGHIRCMRWALADEFVSALFSNKKEKSAFLCMSVCKYLDLFVLCSVSLMVCSQMLVSAELCY